MLARRLSTHRLKDGRALGLSEWGAPDAAPILFSPGAGSSGALGFALDALEPLGVRLVAIDRPGLGRSDPHPLRTLSSFADDVADLCAREGFRAAPIVGFSQGAPFALACAAAGVVPRAALVAGTDELALPALRALLPPELASMIDRVRDDPEGASAFFAGMTAARLREMTLAMCSDEDRRTYTQPAFAESFTRALEEGFAQGSAGYARDTQLAFSPWPFDPARITVPVHLFYGARDVSPVHSPDAFAMLASRIPTSRRAVLDASGSVLFTHGRVILEALVQAR